MSFELPAPPFVPQPNTQTWVVIGTQNFCVVTHRLSPRDPVIWVSWETMSQAFDTRAASQNSEWKRMVIDASDGAVYIEIVSRHTLKWEAMKAAADLRANLQVFTHRVGRPTYKRVRCVEHNVEFKSAAHAAISYGISRSGLSNHLNGRKGYNTIHGLRFEYIS